MIQSCPPLDFERERKKFSFIFSVYISCMQIIGKLMINMGLSNLRYSMTWKTLYNYNSISFHQILEEFASNHDNHLEIISCIEYNCFIARIVSLYLFHLLFVYYCKRDAQETFTNFFVH